MSELTKPQAGGEVEKFDPRKTAWKDKFFEEARRQAQHMRDWPKLDEAVYEQMAEQQKFEAWWTAHVTVRRSPGAKKSNADHRSIISKEKAEELTGISQQQVSIWRKRLKSPDKYRDQLRGPACRKAMAEAAEHNHRAQGTGENEWYTPDEYLQAAHVGGATARGRAHRTA